MRFLIKAILVLVVIGVSGVFGWPYVQAYWKGRNKPELSRRHRRQGDVVFVVNSTGTVQPVLRVQIGAVVSGPIEKLYADHNAKVRKDEFLAKIDDRIYKANVARDQAIGATARADVAAGHGPPATGQERREAGRQPRARRRPTTFPTRKWTGSSSRRMSLEAQVSLAESQVQQAEGELAELARPT